MLNDHICYVYIDYIAFQLSIGFLLLCDNRNFKTHKVTSRKYSSVAVIFFRFTMIHLSCLTLESVYVFSLEG